MGEIGVKDLKSQIATSSLIANNRYLGKSMTGKGLISSDGIQNRIYSIRGLQVMIDSDFAELYRIEAKVLNQAVKRNSERFPAEFMFQLTTDEHDSLRSQFATLDNTNHLRSQIVTSNLRGGRRYLPYALTEQGVAMLSAVLRSETAVRTSIQIINAFVAMRRFLATNAQIFQRLDSVERKQLEADESFKKTCLVAKLRHIF
jgi:hypothetical protein